MIDLNTIREQPDAIRRAAALKKSDADVAGILALDAERRGLVSEADELKAKRNAESKRIAEVKRSGEDAAEAVAAMRAVGEEIKALDGKLAEVGARLDDALLRVPNPPASDVPEGADEACNVEIRRHGVAPTFAFEPRDHQ